LSSVLQQTSTPQDLHNLRFRRTADICDKEKSRAFAAFLGKIAIYRQRFNKMTSNVAAEPQIQRLFHSRQTGAS
jgi:hypothetical protein